MLGTGDIAGKESESLPSGSDRPSLRETDKHTTIIAGTECPEENKRGKCGGKQLGAALAQVVREGFLKE